MMLLFRDFICIHALLIVSALCMSARWWHRYPSHKLRLARCLFVSCICSPVAIRFVNQPAVRFIGEYISFDESERRSEISNDSQKQLPVIRQHFYFPDLGIESCLPFLFFFFALGLLNKARLLASDLKKMSLFIGSTIPYRSRGKIAIKVSDLCHVPFSIRWFNKAYIVLPVSLLGHAEEVKIAIAHEGQHHRQGDCSWAYLIELAAIFFWGSPGTPLWRRIFTELQELSCDEVLVGHRTFSAHDYGHCLYRVAQTASEYSKSNQRDFACTVGMALNTGHYKSLFITRRICMLPKYQSTTLLRSFSTTILAGVFIIAPFCVAYASNSLFPNQSSPISSADMDSKIQAIAETQLANAVKKHQTKSGAVIVADPSTARILAFAESRSSENEESWTTRIFPTASLIKPFIVATAIDSALVLENQIYDCRGPYVVAGQKFENYDPNFADMSVTEAIAKSANVCMIKVAQDIGSAKFREGLSRFGFDTNSGWNPRESDELQLANAAIGEKNIIPVNMRTMVDAYTILANKGHLGPNSPKLAVSEATAKSVSHMLVEAVDNGTGVQAAIPGTSVAGKTGTLKGIGTKGSTSNLALFAGYFPVESPRYVIFVVLEYGDKPKGSGGSLAAPLFHDIAIRCIED